MDLKEKLENFEDVIEGLKERGGHIIDKTKKVGKNVAGKTIGKIDVTGDGKLDIKDIIVLCFKAPICVVKRNDFLQKELSKHCTYEITQKAVESTLSEAGITSDKVDEIAKSVIAIESTRVTSASFALGVTGSISLGASIPTDIIQYYVYILRVIQKLIYLHDFPEINIPDADKNIDDEVINFFVICLGVMHNVVGASDVLKAMMLASKENKNIFDPDGVAKPVTSEIFETAGKNLTKKLISGIISNVLPVVGGVVNGGFTYVSFQPNCHRLRKSLQKAMAGTDKASPTTEDDTTHIDKSNNAGNKTSSDKEDDNTVSNGDKFAELREYKSLLDEGILTQEEFDKKKKELLKL